MFYSHDHKYILYSSIESFACNPEGNYNLVVYTKSGQRHEFNYQSREE